MAIPIEFRAKRTDNRQWIHGVYGFKKLMNKHFILVETTEPYSRVTSFDEVEVLPETVGQLRYVKKNTKYFDGDVYYHAGYGMETVSDICEIQFALAAGNADDIGDIAGNLVDNPEFLKL